MFSNILRLTVGLVILILIGKEINEYIFFLSLDYIIIIGGIVIGSFFVFSSIFKCEISKSLDVLIFLITFVIGCFISFLFGTNLI